MQLSPDQYIELLKADEVERPFYGFILLNAALQAKALNIPVISVIEFGVAEGAGLICMESHADFIEAVTGVKLQVLGFDNGIGLPDHNADYRDVPFVWQKGMFKMDVSALRQKLRRAELVIGDVRDTVPKLLENPNLAPIGAISFDLDYYSSTKAAFDIFKLPSINYLPRVFCYFDDLFGNNPFQAFNDHVGQQLAIKEFNSLHNLKKLTPLPQLRYMRSRPHIWNEKIFVFHDFEHIHYNNYISHGVYKALM